MNKIKKYGQAPGTLYYTGKRIVENAIVSLMDYNENVVHEEILEDVDVLKNYKERQTTTWVNVDGLYDTKTIEKIGNIFELHPLIMEDILNVSQRPKVDFHKDYTFIVCKMLNYNDAIDVFENEQLSIVFGKNFVITFQEEAGDPFEPVRERIRKKAKINAKGPDYLVYAILDMVVDTYFHVNERMGEWIEDLERQILNKPNRRRPFEISDLKRDALFLRRNIWPVREVIHSLQRNEDGIISSDNRFYFNDLYDHVIQNIDNLENYRDMTANLMELYLSNISQKMNEVMKTLTIIATIFIPITFITSWYGMNFKYMPELNTRYGYPTILAIIVCITIGMLYYFKRKDWL